MFKSYHPDYEDGGQLRDFVYVKDVCKIILWFLHNPSVSGLFNVGTGPAQSVGELARATFSALGEIQPNIEFIDMPETLKEKYQYYTQAEMDKLHAVGCNIPMMNLEQGVKDYVTEYLAKSYANY